MKTTVDRKLANAKKVLGTARLLSILKTRRSKRPERQLVGTTWARVECCDGW